MRRSRTNCCRIQMVARMGTRVIGHANSERSTLFTNSTISPLEPESNRYAWRCLTRIFHAFEMFIYKASGAPLYECYRKPLITQSMGISGAPAG